MPKSGYGFTVTDDGSAVVMVQANTCNNFADTHTQFFAAADPTTLGTHGLTLLRHRPQRHDSTGPRTAIAAITDGTALN